MSDSNSTTLCPELVKAPQRNEGQMLSAAYDGLSRQFTNPANRSLLHQMLSIKRAVFALYARIESKTTVRFNAPGVNVGLSANEAR